MHIHTQLHQALKVQVHMMSLGKDSKAEEKQAQGL